MRTVQRTSRDSCLRSATFALLQPSGDVISSFSASEFVTSFNGKIAAICTSTAAAGWPTVDARDVPPFDVFGTTVTAEDVAASLRRTTCQQCELEPVPTWPAKQCFDRRPVSSRSFYDKLPIQHIDSPGLSETGNSNVQVASERSRVSVWIHLKWYRPVSNLTFIISKFLERFAVNHQHAGAHSLFPV